jgi:hypothetical protein
MYASISLICNDLHILNSPDIPIGKSSIIIVLVISPLVAQRDSVGGMR